MTYMMNITISYNNRYQISGTGTGLFSLSICWLFSGRIYKMSQWWKMLTLSLNPRWYEMFLSNKLPLIRNHSVCSAIKRKEADCQVWEGGTSKCWSNIKERDMTGPSHHQNQHLGQKVAPGGNSLYQQGAVVCISSYKLYNGLTEGSLWMMDLLNTLNHEKLLTGIWLVQDTPQKLGRQMLTDSQTADRLLSQP